MTQPEVSSVLSGLVATEQIHPGTRDIDLLDTAGILHKINAEDAKVAAAVALAIPQVTVVVDHVVEAFRRGGHLFYAGAGTSGRLGILDAAECPPTFGADPNMVQGIIAGGSAALTHAVEGAEDSETAGRNDFLALSHQSGDVVLGISASGHAPYVHGALKAAREAGCYTAALTCHRQSALIPLVDQAIVVEAGPEVIAGSTRMKAGTAQKLVLNMITTAAMIQVGKTYRNLMVDVQPTNRKLVSRAGRIVAALGGVTEERAHEVLKQTGYRVKPAVLMIRDGIDLPEAERRLSDVSGKLRPALQNKID